MMLEKYNKLKLNNFEYKLLGDGKTLTFVNGEDKYEIILICD